MKIISILFSLLTLTLPSLAALEVQTSRLDTLANDASVVTNVTGTSGVDTNAVRDIASSTSVTNAGAVAVANAGLAGKADATSGKIIGTIGTVITDSHSQKLWGVDYADTATKADSAEFAKWTNVLALNSATSFPFISFGGIDTDGWNVLVLDDENTKTHQIRTSRVAVAASPAVAGDLATLDEYGNTTDSGIATNALLTQATTDKLYFPKATGDAWENYWQGDKVRISVTNYYGNTSGEPPRLCIEEFDHSVTSTVDGVDYVTNIYNVVWDEITRQTNYYNKYAAKIDAISNSTLTAAWKQTNLQLANKAPRAWGDVTSAGEYAPPNTVWHTAPSTVFAGGTEYAHVAVGEGQISVLVNNGAPVYTEGEEGQFRFKDDSGKNYFGFDVRESYTLGCRTDGISVKDQIVTLTYDLTSSSVPEILTCADLLTGTWETASDVSWEENPPSGMQICYINCGSNPSGFYKAQISYAGGSKFITNMQADLAGGIAASNETDNVVQSIEPYIKNGTIYWRVKQ